MLLPSTKKRNPVTADARMSTLLQQQRRCEVVKYIPVALTPTSSSQFICISDSIQLRNKYLGRLQLSKLQPGTGNDPARLFGDL